jgi:Na+/H+ antiporter NhaD/arsenite permease-like protein
MEGYQTKRAGSLQYKIPIAFCAVVVTWMLVSFIYKWVRQRDGLFQKKEGDLTWESYVTGCMAAAALISMVKGAAPEGVLILNTAVLLLLGIINSEQAWRGFEDKNVLAIAVLFAVAKGVDNTMIVRNTLQYLMGGKQMTSFAIFRMCIAVACVSAVLNNTPVVAMMIPFVVDWDRRTGDDSGLYASQLLIPLSYSSMLGGMCTLIGTSTNLILNGLLAESVGDLESFYVFDTVIVGGPVCLAGIMYMVLLAPILLPKNKLPALVAKDPAGAEAAQEKADREKEKADLEMEREVDTKLRKRLKKKAYEVFSGMDTDGDGMLSQKEQVDFYRKAGQDVDDPEVLREIKQHWDIIDTNHDGTISLEEFLSFERRQLPIMREMLLQMDEMTFVQRWLQCKGSDPQSPEKKAVATAMIFFMLGLSASKACTLLEAALITASIFVFTNIMTVEEAFAAVNWNVIVTIVGSYGLSNALQNTGITSKISETIKLLGVGCDFRLMVVLFTTTVFLSSIVSNQATVILLFPVAKELSGCTQVLLIDCTINRLYY